ncbi:serine/threonine-protein phosphatase 6 regulatory ankyrin repeat subunit C-like [Pecten maximus]|uniref:serine/threonine-protein phosphatase 6 regulatory ankyrin repeat subunit C-like n=1 Tax=Pecten maximus TaxID=6579 RepID=UPI001458BC98|nr:serine/threonine-protein phosphatase 6 regulatory ankyrin repeat subunit C-like [Pecten maximus]XP_033752223.1 serine/threonine-protein phosphatase 6 regulatory ankyrin repeat subunit C-like [Pecten maximus]XP_033752224.1 serine/threonine-protein phosphatase 6 regulatory ankyrin repeat subunit C-like [Pecten maximus]XP_033752225.1 serine/threonine-protein phosphatase 6 regulatory ankyrin repeat subunit C-like [Pecten maximus]
MEVKTLHTHIRDGDFKAARQLVFSGVDVNQIYCRDTAFSLALDQQNVNVKIVELLLSCSQFDPNSKNHFDRTPLFCAAKFGNVAIVNHLLSFDVEADQADLDGVTPLGATVWYDCSEVASTLIRAGADVNRSDKRGESPLLRACSIGSFNVAKVLLESGCDVNKQTLDFRSPLMECIPSSMCTNHPCDKTELLNLLLKHNCDTNLQDRSGCSALHLCVFRDQLLSACILAENGCNMTLRNNDGLTAIHLAMSPGRQYLKFASSLILYGCDLHAAFPEIESDSGPMAMLLKGLSTSNMCPKATSTERRLLLQLLLSDFDHFRVNKSRLQKLLDVHVEGNGLHGDLEIIRKFCLDRSPDSLQRISRRKIRRCLGNKIIQNVHTLPLCSSLKHYLAFGLNYYQTNPTKLLELQLAVKNGHLDKILQFRREGVDINFPFLGNTPLLVAIQYGKDASVQALLSAGADPKVLGFEGDNVLHIAARYGRENMISHFIQYGCDINTKNKKGNLPIHEACQSGNFISARLLLSQGSLVALSDNFGIFPIHYVTASGDLETLRHMLAKDSSVDLVDRYRNTPLHLAASNGILYLRRNIPLPALYSSELTMNLDMMNIIHANKKVLGSGARASKEHKRIVEELMNAGSNKTLENLAGQTAISVALEFECLEYFQMENA